MSKGWQPLESFEEFRKRQNKKPKAILSPQEKLIKQIKYIIEHSPFNNKWNNIWVEDNLTIQGLFPVIKSLAEVGLKVTCHSPSRDLAQSDPSVSIILDVELIKPLEQGLNHPVWGASLAKLKSSRAKLLANRQSPSVDSLSEGFTSKESYSKSPSEFIEKSSSAMSVDTSDMPSLMTKAKIKRPREESTLRIDKTLYPLNKKLKRSHEGR